MTVGMERRAVSHSGSCLPLIPFIYEHTNPFLFVSLIKLDVWQEIKNHPFLTTQNSDKGDIIKKKSSCARECFEFFLEPLLSQITAAGSGLEESVIQAFHIAPNI